MTWVLIYPASQLAICLVLVLASRTASKVDLNRLREIAYICAVVMRPKIALQLRAREAETEPTAEPLRLIEHGRDRAGGVGRSRLRP
ncbi:hypothetical protein [Rhodococcus sp. IEGM 1381]|uniref:hypothetical protein n=1 Tax=Rhodococcus sp. IEGM 1381 TaxID=3047085 RepID=UPI0024B730C5|nr:hypothetical protein [Rhodococcus sp. IEGM 1381]